jgi:hypothetical protein
MSSGGSYDGNRVAAKRGKTERPTGAVVAPVCLASQDRPVFSPVLPVIGASQQGRGRRAKIQLKTKILWSKSKNIILLHFTLLHEGDLESPIPIGSRKEPTPVVTRNSGLKLRRVSGMISTALQTI